jgi:hypothetical protein
MVVTMQRSTNSNEQKITRCFSAMQNVEDWPTAEVAPRAKSNAYRSLLSASKAGQFAEGQFGETIHH